ncbi:winged helix-turn-helix domain-containing protein [Specibacter cremeus]|uniref:winged helix-turn-helix domain-containing protein n=1 Tax=Specibacter cremeus TaxID=1629051 RepID=UPI000F76B873|nr:winged helix-turn-helix domain-containing protein [Specibacter cremeus]
MRLEVVDEFYSSTRLHTATELARRFGLTPSAMSYHLRALEKWGYVVRAEAGGDGRERYWRAAGDSLNIGSLRQASELVSSSFMEVTLGAARDRVMRALAYSEQFTEETRPVFVLSNSKFLLTKEQAQQFADDFDVLERRYRDLSDAAEESDDGGAARHTHVTMIMVPEVPPGQ